MTLLATRARSPETVGTITISEDSTRAVASLAVRRGQDMRVGKVARDLFGTDLPPPGHGTGAGADPWHLVWTAPGQWFVSAPVATHEDLERRLRLAFDDTVSVTEQTGAWTRFTLAGAAAVDVMERLTMLDASAMRPGEATRTIVHHLNVFIERTEDGFAISGPRSSSASLHHALIEAARSVD